MCLEGYVGEISCFGELFQFAIREVESAIDLLPNFVKDSCPVGIDTSDDFNVC